MQRSHPHPASTRASLQRTCHPPRTAWDASLSPVSMWQHALDRLKLQPVRSTLGGLQVLGGSISVVTEFMVNPRWPASVGWWHRRSSRVHGQP
jgi:hypothetical protein